jgi:hypothetical protein
MAEFYRRTGHPGSAWFYYELVRRRYPGTLLAEKAGERMESLSAEVQAAAQGTDGPWGRFKRGFDKYILGRGVDSMGASAELNIDSLNQYTAPRQQNTLPKTPAEAPRNVIPERVGEK